MKTLPLKVAKRIISFLFLASLVSFIPIEAGEYFDSASIRLLDGQSLSDLEQVSQGGLLPGKYLVDVYVNSEMFEKREVEFLRGNDTKVLRPRLTVADIRAMGVKPDVLKKMYQSDGDEVLDFGKLIPGATVHFNIYALRLDIKIPHEAIVAHSRDEISQDSWDQGVTALFINYGASGAHNKSEQGLSSNDTFVRLNSGINVGAWRLRNGASYSTGYSGSRLESIDTYLHTDIPSVKGQLTLGDTSSVDRVFDSVQFRGMQLYSDEQMKPDSARGFAPVVRGIAKSDAQVTIRQNGYIVYQTQVAPGAFAITDLYPSMSSGNLDVTVRESDGTEQTFVQPLSSIPIMQRQGSLKYTATLGEYRSFNDSAATPVFLQSSLIYGVDNSLTLYAGTQLASNYRAALMGAGQGMGMLGALSLDVTHASTRLQDDSRHDGQSFRAQYAKQLFQSGTNFTLAGYRYSTQGFHDFREANEISQDNSMPQQRYNKRSRMSLQVSQSLGDLGSLFVNGTSQKYWRREGTEHSLMMGYTGYYSGVSYGINYSLTQSSNAQDNNQVSFNLQVPFSQWSSSARARYQFNTSNKGQTSHEAGISGTALTGSNLNYSASQRYGNRGEGVGARASLDYKGTHSVISGAYSYGKDLQTISYGISGALVAHPYGVTLAREIGDASVLVRAPGASGVELYNQEGLRTDWRGYAVVPHVSAYRKNRISLDTGSLPAGVDVDGKSQVVVPTRGAFVVADFETRQGARALITLRFRGKSVPFGAASTLQHDSKAKSGMVGEGGQVYLSGLPSSGRLKVQWGKAQDEQCVADFRLPQGDVKTYAGLQSLHAECL